MNTEILMDASNHTVVSIGHVLLGYSYKTLVYVKKDTTSWIPNKPISNTTSRHIKHIREVFGGTVTHVVDLERLPNITENLLIQSLIASHLKDLSNA